jgi:hypothetical protein
MPTYTLRITFPTGNVEEAPFPAAVKEFLDAFNRGGHPDLELSPDIPPST